jgi:hypothetical protein
MSVGALSIFWPTAAVVVLVQGTTAPGQGWSPTHGANGRRNKKDLRSRANQKNVETTHEFRL